MQDVLSITTKIHKCIEMWFNIDNPDAKKMYTFKLIENYYIPTNNKNK